MSRSRNLALSCTLALAASAFAPDYLDLYFEEFSRTVS